MFRHEFMSVVLSVAPMSKVNLCSRFEAKLQLIFQFCSESCDDQIEATGNVVPGASLRFSLHPHRRDDGVQKASAEIAESRQKAKWR